MAKATTQRKLNGIGGRPQELVAMRKHLGFEATIWAIF